MLALESGIAANVAVTFQVMSVHHSESGGHCNSATATQILNFERGTQL